MTNRPLAHVQHLQGQASQDQKAAGPDCSIQRWHEAAAHAAGLRPFDGLAKAAARKAADDADADPPHSLGAAAFAQLK